MADSKITALTAISTVDPTADPLVIVDVSDTSMAASGTTKKSTINQLLGSGGTATLASATITGAATVGTTLGVTGVSTFAAGTALLPALTTTGDTNTGIYYPAADTFAVTTGGAERYRVDSSGNVGIGVTPSAKLDVYQATLGTAYFRGGYSARQLTLTATTDGVNDGAVHTFSIGSSSGQFLFANSGGTRLTIDPSGNLGIGVTPAGTGGCLQLKSGITFPATQVASSDANTLDDYEEGTWTGTLTGTVANPTIPVTATGRYTKVGRQVTVQVYISNVVTTGASGRIGISGLPFANNGSTETIGAVGFYDIATFTGSPFAQIGFNATQVDLYSNISNSVYGTVTHNAGNNRYLWFNMTYTVA